MGLLDEAIRDHLELKRRHGADATEIARLEQEALGPARRTPADAAPEAAPGSEAPGPDTAAGVNGQEPSASEPETPATEAPTTVHAPAVEDEYEYVYEGDEEFDEAEPAAEVPTSTQVPPPAEAPPTAQPEQQTAEFEPASEEEWADDWDEREGEEPEPNVPPAAQEGEKAEDVLEETPEFLQETPEHDRLWFEQKPPRDFEF